MEFKETQDDNPLGIPQNIDAEKRLLAGILRDNRLLESAGELLKPEYFALRGHGEIFRQCQRLVDQGGIADAVTLKSFFESHEDLKGLGGALYLEAILTDFVPLVQVEAYGRIVRDRYIRRQLLGISGAIEARSRDFMNYEEAQSVLEAAEQDLFHLSEDGGGTLADRMTSFESAVTATLKTIEAAYKKDTTLVGVSTGFHDLDDLLGGLHRSDLLILAGRPAMGKTALATTIAYKAAARSLLTKGREGAVVGFFSLEMSAEQLTLRVLSSHTKVGANYIRHGKLTDEEFNRIALSCQDLAGLPLYIDDTPALSIAGLRTAARRMKRRYGLDLVVVDYLQLLASNRRVENRVQELSEITRGLKTLAKELDIPVLALSQLSRQVEARDDKRPQLADLRESGTIEQDADVVMFVYREEYYLERHQPQPRENEDMTKYNQRHQAWEERLTAHRNIAEVILGKQRHGPLGTVSLQFDGRYTSFADLSHEDKPRPSSGARPKSRPRGPRDALS